MAGKASNVNDFETAGEAGGSAFRDVTGDWRAAAERRRATRVQLILADLNTPGAGGRIGTLDPVDTLCLGDAPSVVPQAEDVPQTKEAAAGEMPGHDSSLAGEAAGHAFRDVAEDWLVAAGRRRAARAKLILADLNMPGMGGRIATLEPVDAACLGEAPSGPQVDQVRPNSQEL